MLGAPASWGPGIDALPWAFFEAHPVVCFASIVGPHHASDHVGGRPPFNCDTSWLWREIMQPALRIKATDIAITKTNAFFSALIHLSRRCNAPNTHEHHHLEPGLARFHSLLPQS